MGEPVALSVIVSSGYGYTRASHSGTEAVGAHLVLDQGRQQDYC